MLKAEVERRPVPWWVTPAMIFIAAAFAVTVAGFFVDVRRINAPRADGSRPQFTLEKRIRLGHFAGSSTCFIFTKPGTACSEENISVDMHTVITVGTSDVLVGCGSCKWSNTTGRDAVQIRPRGAGCVVGVDCPDSGAPNGIVGKWVCDVRDPTRPCVEQQ